MSDPVGAQGVTDPGTALRREVETLHDRFPETPRADLDRRIQHAYTELKAHARIGSHLITLASAQVTDELLHDGAVMHHRGEDTEQQ